MEAYPETGVGMMSEYDDIFMPEIGYPAAPPARSLVVLAAMRGNLPGLRSGKPRMKVADSAIHIRVAQLALD